MFYTLMEELKRPGVHHCSRSGQSDGTNVRNSAQQSSIAYSMIEGVAITGTGTLDPEVTVLNDETIGERPHALIPL
jgi:hypothetical protein